MWMKAALSLEVSLRLLSLAVKRRRRHRLLFLNLFRRRLGLTPLKMILAMRVKVGKTIVATRMEQL